MMGASFALAKPIPRGSPTFASALVSAIGWVKNPLYVDMVNRYMSAVGGTMVLTPQQALQAAPVHIDFHESPEFEAALEDLRKRHGGERHLAIGVPAGNDVLGHFTVFFKDLHLVVNRDYSYRAGGLGTFYDEWNFDWKTKGERHVVAEGVTRTVGELLVGGKGFTVISLPIMIHQNAGEDEAVMAL